MVASISFHRVRGLYLNDHGTVGYNWGYKSPKWGYPNYNLLITLLTKSHEPLNSGARVSGV